MVKKNNSGRAVLHFKIKIRICESLQRKIIMCVIIRCGRYCEHFRMTDNERVLKGSI